MLNKTPKRSKIVLVLSILFVMSAIVPTSLAGKDSSSVVVFDYAARDNLFFVWFQNFTHRAQSVYFAVVATVGSTNVSSPTPATVFLNAEEKTVVGSTTVSKDVESAGIVESGSPM